MRNRRMVSNKICIDEKIHQLSVKDRWLWVSLLVNLDEYGRFSGNIYEVKMICVPADNEYTIHSIRKSLSKFVDLGLANWQENIVIEFPNFEKYQTFNHRRKNSDYPSLIKTKPIKKVLLKNVDEFNTFWSEYPKGRKYNKIKMGQTLQSAINNDVGFDSIMKALRSQKKKWALLEPHLIPHMSTWLNQCRWEMEDQVEVNVNTEERLQELICSECEHRFKAKPMKNTTDKKCPKCNEYGVVDLITFNLMKGTNANKQT